MESLLRWSIENSSASDASTTAQKKDLDPAIIDAILGRPDAELMKEDVSIAIDDKRNEPDRAGALEHLEMLVEQIDNANDLAKLQLWEPLHRLLIAPHSTSQIKMQTLWVIGTAVQNNPAAQDAYLALNPLPTLISFLTPSVPSSLLSEKEQTQITSKAIYAISGLLKHNAPAVAVFDDPDVQGWDGLKEALQHPEITVRRKAIFLINTLLLPSSPSSPTNIQANIHTSPTAQQQQTQPAYPNSHSVHITSPTRVLTAPLTYAALETHPTLLQTITHSLTSPLPHGPDGDLGLDDSGNGDGVDAQYEETAMWVVYRFVVTGSGAIEVSLKDELKTWLLDRIEREGRGARGRREAETSLAERWGLDVEQLRDLVRRFD